MIERYNKMYQDMSTSKDVEKMRVFGSVGKWMFRQMVETNPRAAQMALDKLEAMYWNNYLSDAEAKEICAKLVNQVGGTGGKWSKEAFLQVVEKLNGEVQKFPAYNENALWATANMLYSDHASTLLEFIPEADMPKAIYKLSVDKLKDKDRPRFVRDYFHV